MQTVDCNVIPLPVEHECMRVSTARACVPSEVEGMHAAEFLQPLQSVW